LCGQVFVGTSHVQRKPPNRVIIERVLCQIQTTVWGRADRGIHSNRTLSGVKYLLVTTCDKIRGYGKSDLTQFRAWPIFPPPLSTRLAGDQGKRATGTWWKPASGVARPRVHPAGLPKVGCRHGGWQNCGHTALCGSAKRTRKCARPSNRSRKCTVSAAPLGAVLFGGFFCFSTRRRLAVASLKSRSRQPVWDFPVAQSRFFAAARQICGLTREGSP